MEQKNSQKRERAENRMVEMRWLTMMVDSYASGLCWVGYQEFDVDIKVIGSDRIRPGKETKLLDLA